MNSTNRRILVIDDNQAIHQDFRKILGPGRGTTSDLALTEGLLFGDAPPTESQGVFEIDSAFQGQEGLALIQKSLEEKRPYAMAFVDVRMPPGWDGIETTARIWQEYPDLQVVVCTAYSDYSWEGMLAKLGHSDRLVILKKPFDNIEVLQLAGALTEKWHLYQQAKGKLDDLDEGTIPVTKPAGMRTRLVSALTNMGYRPSEAEKAVSSLGQRVDSEPLGDLIKLALAELR